MSTRIDTLDPALQEIFQEEEVIAINQDYAGKAGLPVSSPLSQAGVVWGKPLSPKFKYLANATAGFKPMRPAPACGASDCGSAAFLAPNGSPAAKNTTVMFADLGYTPTTRAMVRDAVARKDLGVFTGSFTALLPQDASRLLIITPAAAQ